MLTITRAPLAPLVTNTHYAMSAPDDRARRTTRRTSARISEKENTNSTTTNGIDSDANILSATRPTKGKGAGKSSAAAAKRKQDYDEEDDGFLFTRTKAKKVKTTTAAVARVPETVAEEGEEGEQGGVREQEKVVPKKRGRKEAEEEVLQDREQNRDAVISRRGGRVGNGDRQDDEPAPLEVKKKRKSEAKTPEPDPAATKEPEERGRSRRIVPESRTPGPGADVTTKIALPFADTPIIRRNQEMRRGKEGSRRSSLGNRGRRASSLIDSGRSSALPHESVESAEFFKHIESGLPEPRRMKQLLTWCATRALNSEKSKRAAEVSGKDAAVRAAAKEIQQQILKDFGARSEMSDWFGREETEEGESELGPVVKKPNPKNLANEAKIRELEAQLQR